MAARESINLEPRAGRRHADQFLVRQSLETRRPGCSSRAFVCFDLRLLCDRTRKKSSLKPDLYDTPRHPADMAVPDRTPSIPNLRPFFLPLHDTHHPPRRHPTKKAPVGFDRSPHLHVSPHGPMGAHSIPPPGCFAVCPEWRDLPRRRDTHPSSLAKAPRNIPVLGADRGYNW